MLSHLGLGARPAPGEAHNVTAEQPPVSRILRRLDDAGLLSRLPPLSTTVERGGRQVLQHVGQRGSADADGELPDAVVTRIWDDVSRLEDWLGRRLWKRNG